jgi:hypothetical protein
MKEPIDSITVHLPVAGWRTDPDGELSGIKDIINITLEERTTGTFSVAVAKPSLEAVRSEDIDMDAKRKQRIAKWIHDYVYFKYEEDGVDENDLEGLLLEFEKFLDECEVERQRQ